MELDQLFIADDWIIAARAMLQIMINFWPVVALFVGYCVYETYFMKAGQE